METIGIRAVPLTRLRLPGDFKKTLEGVDASLRAKSIAAIGLVHEPIVRMRDWRPIVGFDDIAAHFLLEKKKVLCKLVECTDEEFETIRAEEAKRRPKTYDSPEYRSALLERVEKAVQAPIEGSTKKPTTLAREAVAAELGIQPESLRIAIWRAKQPKKVKPKRPEPPKVCNIRTLGMTITVEYAEQMADLDKLMNACATHLQLALGCLTKIETAELPFHAPRMQRLKGEVAAAGAAIRGAVPDCLCPWCKGLEQLQELCGGCFGHGFITKSQMAGVPSALLNEDNPQVMDNGQLRPVSDFEEDVWP